MKPDLRPGIRYQHRFRVPDSKTVPALYPESPEFLAMPEVFATGFLVGLLEWACIRAINPYLVEGKKTGGLEIAEQCASDPPDWVSASVGE